MSICALAALLSSSAALAANTASDANTDLSSPENKAAAEFAVEVASKSISYAQSVERKGGAAVVTVIVGNIECRVTVDEQQRPMQAQKIECSTQRGT